MKTAAAFAIALLASLTSTLAGNRSTASPLAGQKTQAKPLEHLLKLAEGERKYIRCWAHINHWTHQIIMATAYAVPIAVAFGLVLKPADDSLAMRVLLASSAVALILQVWDNTARFPERVRHGTRLWRALDVDIARYKDGCLSDEEFEANLTKIMLASAEEPWV